MQRRSFLRGAFILVAGSLASRALGAVYRIVLPILMGGGQRAAYGMGLFMLAYPVYTVMLNLAAVGVPLAISKLVSEHMARGDRSGAARVFRVSLLALALIGLASSLLLAALASPVAYAFAHDPRAAISILAIAPAIFFVSLETAYRGFFQGLQHMGPQAVSTVVEQIGRIGTMFLLAALLLPFGIQYAAAGASFGAVTGAVAGLIYLLRVFRRDAVARPVRTARPADIPARRVLGQVAALAVPISLAGIVLPLMNLMDAAVVPNRLLSSGFGAREAVTLYGVFTSYAMPFIVAPTILTSSLSVSLVPSVSEALALDQREVLQARAATGLRVTILVLLPSAVGLMLLGHQIPQLFFHSAQAALPLIILAPAVLFMGTQQVTSGILQGLGFPGTPMRNLIVGGILKFVLTWTLVAVPAINISGAAVGTTVAFLAAATMNVVAVQRRVGRPLQLGRMVAAPALAAAAMALSVWGTLLVLHHVGLLVATAGAIMAGVVVYAVALLAVGGVRSRDLQLVPRIGPQLARQFERMHWVRS